MYGDDHEITIAVMGATGSGKSTFINQASGSVLQVGRGLRSCTNVIQVARSFALDGRSVTLIDTPGFDDTTISDTDILRMISTFLSSAYEHNKKLAGVIFLHRISDFRVGGVSTRNFRMFRKLCGEDALQNVILVTNMWGEVGDLVGAAREEELATDDQFFRPIMQKGAKMMRHGNTTQSAHNIIRRILNNVPVPLRIQRELVEENLELRDTAAGQELGKELAELEKKHRVEMAKLKTEMEEAIRMKDEETRMEIEAERALLQTQLRRVQADAVKLESDFREENENLKKMIEEAEEASRQEALTVAAAHRRQIETLEERLQNGNRTAAAEQAEMKRQLVHLQGQYQQALQRGSGKGMFIFGIIAKVLVTGVLGAVAPSLVPFLR